MEVSCMTWTKKYQKEQILKQIFAEKSSRKYAEYKLAALVKYEVNNLNNLFYRA